MKRKKCHLGVLKILIIDAHSGYHIGNAALLESTMLQLKQYFPNAEYDVLAFDPPSLEKLCACPIHWTLWADPIMTGSYAQKLVWLVREMTWALIHTVNLSMLHSLGVCIPFSAYTFSDEKQAALDAYTQADIVVSISGEAMNDNFWRRLPLFLYGYWMAHKLGKLVAIFPQSIGPIELRFTRLITKYVLNLCNLVCPRDILSLRTLQRLDIRSKVCLVPDVAVAQPYIFLQQAQRLLSDEGVKIEHSPLVGIAVCRWKGLVTHIGDAYIDIIRQLCDYVTKQLNGSIILFSPNMPFNVEASDWEVSKELFSSIEHKENVTLLSRLYTPREFKGMLGAMDLFVTAKMHAAILSTMAATPTITINTQPKLYGYMQMIGQERNALDLEGLTLETLVQLVNDLLGNSDNVRRQLSRASEELVPESKNASRLLRELHDRMSPGGIT